jgi:hypothetical protein
MMGKSRCLKQMASSVYTVHMSLRTNKESGYPEARFFEYFEQVETENTETRVLRVACLMVAMVKVLIAKIASEINPASFWNLQEKSFTYEAEVVQSANGLYHSLKGGDHVINSSDNDLVETSFSPQLRTIIRERWEEYDRLLAKSSDQGVTLLLSLDEAAFLAKSNSKHHRPLFKDVRRTLRIFRRDFSGLFSVFPVHVLKSEQFYPSRRHGFLSSWA